MTYRTGWARLAALWQRFVRFCGRERVPVKVIDKGQILTRLAEGSRARRQGR